MKFRHWLMGFMLATQLGIVPAVRSQQTPLTQRQVESLVSSGLGDESGAKIVEERGIDFAPGGDFLQSLKTAGASDAFIEALRKAERPRPLRGTATKPLNQVQIFALLTGGVPSHRVAMLIDERGIDFSPTNVYLEEVKLAGGQDDLVRALKSAKVTNLPTPDPAARTLQVEVRAHAAHGSQLFHQERYQDAEGEYLAAVRLDPQSPDLRVALSRDLTAEGKTDAALKEAREALRLNPDDDLGHFSVGSALEQAGDRSGAVAEYREALRLNPENGLAHNNLGVIFGSMEDWDGAIKEYQEAVRIEPEDDRFHFNLASALGNKGDFDGEIAEARAALRLNPKNEDALVGLGFALGSKGDWDGDIAAERAALRLNPNNAMAHANLGTAFEGKGDVRGAIAEYRAAQTLDPENPTIRATYERLMWHINE